MFFARRGKKRCGNGTETDTADADANADEDIVDSAGDC